jgi:hypothetical protein
MTRAKITVSGYAGKERQDIEKMCHAMGAQFTRYLSPDHTHLIAAASQGEKFERAAEWNVHVVNILWLEETFAQWEYVREAQARFVTFNTGLTMNLGVEDALDWVRCAEKELEKTEKDEIMIDEPEPMLEVAEPMEATNQIPVSSEIGEKENNKPTSPVKSTAEDVKKAASTPKKFKKISPVKASSDSTRGTPTSSKKRKNEEQIESKSLSGSATKKARGQTPKTTKALLRVVFTGCRPPPDYLDFLKKNGVQLVASVYTATHVVAEKIARTEKLLTAISLGKSLVSLDWVKKSVTAKTLMGRSGSVSFLNKDF